MGLRLCAFIMYRKYVSYSVEFLLVLRCRYLQCVEYFCIKPKSGEKEVAPKEFFGMWMPFCQEFKELWKREQKRISKERSALLAYIFPV